MLTVRRGWVNTFKHTHTLKIGKRDIATGQMVASSVDKTTFRIVSEDAVKDPLCAMRQVEILRIVSLGMLWVINPRLMRILKLIRLDKETDFAALESFWVQRSDRYARS